MFGKKKSEDYSAATTVVGEKLTTIAEGTVMTGRVVVEGNLRLDGTIEGDVSCKGKVVIGAQGKITGNVECDTAVLHGVLCGDIRVTESLVMKSGCTMNGDVYTCKLEIESQARFNGACNTVGNNKPVESKAALSEKPAKAGK